MTFFRAQTADRDPKTLIDDTRSQISYAWDNFDEYYARPGVSACRSLDDLIGYLAQAGIPVGAGAWVVVELDGDRVHGATPVDERLGEVLVWPTEIVAVVPLDDDLFQRIGDAHDAINA